MNTSAAYTPLESLFLFQSLLTQGVDPGAFVRVSEILKNNALIKSGDTYDPARLTPEALQQLFLLLLREEMRREADGADGSASPGSRKRKLGSPPLPSLQDAYEHVEKVPALIDRLYARYREHIVEQIREDERQIAVVQNQIQVLEKNEKERLAKAASQNGAPTLAPRDAKAAGGPQAPSPAPVPPTRGAAAAAKRGPTPSTPIYPAKPPTRAVAQPAVTPPSRLPAAVAPPPARPSPKPANVSGSVLQPPAGVPQAATRVLQLPAQPPKPVAPPPAANKPKDAALGAPQSPAQAQAPAAPAGVLKWEKPYQPPAAQAPPTAGPLQKSGPPAAAGLQKSQQPQQTPATAAALQKSQQLQQTPSSTAAALKGQQPPQQRQPPPPPSPAQPPAQQTGQQTPGTAPQPRPPRKQVLVAPQTGQLASPLRQGSRPTAGAAPPARPHSTTPIVPPTPPTRPDQPLQTRAHAAQPAQPAQAVQQPSPRPVAAAPLVPPKVPGPVAAVPKWPQAQAAAQQAQRPSTASPALTSQEDKPYASPYASQPPRPAIPEHIIRQAASTPGPKRPSPASVPQTPASAVPASLTRGFGTKWASVTTPSTPGPTRSEPESPAYEPVSPPQRAASIISDTPRVGVRKVMPRPTPQGEVTASRPRGRPPRNAAASATPSVSGTRRSQSVASQTDELSMDHSVLSTKIKKEVLTPRPHDDAGETTADESVHGRALLATPGSVSSRLAKRKRQETPPEPPAPPTQVLWTRGFTKVSSSALDQISSHRHANMFATGVRERDAPNYRQIVLQPQDITSIRAAIKQGNKAAVQAAASLPGGDPGTANVWLPISEDLVPPKGIVNSAQLERELVHMFCNAIMYNPDPDRGPGAAFVKRSQDEEEEIVGYHLDENGVVKNTRSMFVEVEKLLGELRSAEKDCGLPPLSAPRPSSAATPADDTAEDEDELAGDGNTTASVVKRRRIGTRG